MDFAPFFVSIKIAFFATLITFVLGIFFAWIAGNSKKIKPFLDSILSLPLVLPPTVTGFLLLMLFGKTGTVGSFLAKIGLNFLFTWQGGVIAAVVISFPVMYRTTRGAFDQIDPDIISAARTLGMSEAKIFVKIMIPVSYPGIAAAVILSFARAVGEFGATIMVAGNIPGKTQTMALAVYTAMQGGNKILAAKWVCLILAVSFVILCAMNLWTEKISQKKFGAVKSK